MNINCLPTYTLPTIEANINKSDNLDQAALSQTKTDIDSALEGEGYQIGDFRRTKKLRVRLSIGLAVTDIICIVAAYMIAVYYRLGTINTPQLSDLLFVCLPVYLALALNLKAYGKSTLESFWKSYSRTATAFIFTIASILLTMFALKASSDYSRVIIGFGSTLAIMFLFAGRLAMSYLNKKLINNKAITEIIIKDGLDLEIEDDILVLDTANLNLDSDIKNPSTIRLLGELTQNIDRLIIHCPNNKRAVWSALLRTIDIQGEIVTPELSDLSPVALNHRNGHIALLISQGPLRWNERVMKRVFDLSLSIPALILLAIPMMIVAIIIKLESKGPVLFKQQRIGLGNRPFTIFKFRSMKSESSDSLGATSTQRDDNRVTRVGDFIRKTSIDELPQIMNIILGDMSVVGPRPHAMGSTVEDQLFWNVDEQYWHRHTIKPGLTGLAQILGYRGATEKREDLQFRLKADSDYRANWSIWMDIKIVLMTFRVLVHRNAY